MAFADRLKSLFKQGEGVVASNKDKAHQAVNTAAEQADKRTGGKYSDQIRRAEQKAGDAVDKMGDEEGSGSAGAPDAPGVPHAPGAPDAPGTGPAGAPDTPGAGGQGGGGTAG